MFSFLLVIIYLAFISLGLPDALLGSAWPDMAPELSASLSYAGIISMLISASTIVSSLISDRVVRRFGVGTVTAVSVSLTAVALLGFAVSRSFALLLILAIPYGLGAGSVDAALNNYVALNYKARHMSWLHCFWGIGASVGPVIMGQAIAVTHSWRYGYGTVAAIQVVLSLVLFCSIPLWKKNNGEASASGDVAKPLSFSEIFKIRGVKAIFAAFFGYCAFEWTAGLWASSYLASHRGMSSEKAASYASLFYTGITVGRLICGFISDRLGDKRLIRFGAFITLGGIILLLIPIGGSFLAPLALAIIGFGAAPIYPSLIHSVPSCFGVQNSQAIIGLQMAIGYIGNTLMPPLFGLIAEHISIAFYPPFMMLFVLLMIIMSELLNKLCRDPQ